MSDKYRPTIRPWLEATFQQHSGETGFLASIGSLLQVQTASFVKSADDGAANTATANTQFHYVPYDAELLFVRYTDSLNTGITGSDTNYAHMYLKYRVFGGGLNQLALRSFTNGVDLAGNGNIEIPITSADVPAGAMLGIQIDKVGTGVVVPAGVLTVVYRFK